MKKTIISSICVLMALSGCSGTAASSNTQLSENTSGIRVSDGYIEYQDEDGNWKQLIAIDELKGEDGKDGKDGEDGTDGKDGVNGKNGTNGVNGKDGADGINGTNGTSGTNGINGTNGKDGKDGKDGTIVTVNDEGYLVLDGVATTWKLNSDSSSSGSSYTIDENGSILLNGSKTGWKVTKDNSVKTQLATPVITYCEQVSNTTIGVRWEQLEGVESTSYAGAVYINGEIAEGTFTTGNYRTVNIPNTIKDEDIEVRVVLSPMASAYSASEMSAPVTTHVTVNRCSAPTNVQITETDGTYKITCNSEQQVFARVNRTSSSVFGSGALLTQDDDGMTYYLEYTPSFGWYEDEGDYEYTVELWSDTDIYGAEDIARSESVYQTFTVHHTK